MKRTTKLRIFYKSKSSGQGHNPYHTGGLAANALHTVGVLRREGVDVDLVAVSSFDELAAYLRANPDITHAVIEAVWVKASEVVLLSHAHPHLKIVVRAHSKIGFLQVEPEAIPVIRALIDLGEEYPNISFSSNNQEFCNSLGEVYGDVLYLPNLFDWDGSPPKKHSHDRILRLASFGATRLLKLHSSAALAALQVAVRLDRQLEFYVNTDNTPGGHSVRNTMRNLFAGLPWAKLIEVSWQDAATFRETIAEMDLVFQLSATETFCLVAADAVSSGVPVIVGEAVSWVPERYQSNIDDTSEAATEAIRALESSHKTVKVQQEALNDFVESSTRIWRTFLGMPSGRESRKNLWWIF
jgi:hypothetical protein